MYNKKVPRTYFHQQLYEMAAPRPADHYECFQTAPKKEERRSAGRWAKCPRTCPFPPQNSWPYEKDKHKGETAHHTDRNIY